ncbi:MAG TPA: metalloregulator ArsR/SmtB family transcription factor [Stellaceae bacterium]|nr:metalloregulator ArsR/SmtB family transcription factor [Stellaceae bacterium]
MEKSRRLSPTADRLLGLIKRRGPQRAGDLGRALGVTAEAARQQLVQLAEAGLVAPESQKRGVGRPFRLWSLTAAGHARFPDTHAELTVQLIDAIRNEFGDGALDRLIESRQDDIRRAYRLALEGARTLGARVARLAEIRAREGYMAEWRKDGDDFLLLEHHCPICTAATACQGFCRSELDIFRDALGRDAVVERVEHLLAGARRCAYRIRRAASPKRRGSPKEVNRGLDRRALGG